MPPTELGWQFDHFIGYFGITLLLLFRLVTSVRGGGVLVAAAFLLEGLQAFTPDRVPSTLRMPSPGSN
jgi:hypothetical protein